jgi:hypothetical protein
MDVSQITGIDVGIGVNDASIDGTTTPSWGPYASTHVYEVMWAGDGNPISVRYHDGYYPNNSGSIVVEILALQ